MLSLLGSLLGFGTSFLPKILGFFEEKRDQAHELRLMEKQLEQQIAIGAQKMQMMNIQADISETEALHGENERIVVKASTWVVNLNATVRPVIAYMLFFEFFILTWLLAFDLITLSFYRAIWDEPMQAVFATVVAFFYGSRSFNRKNHT